MTFRDRIKAVYSKLIPRKKTARFEPGDIESQLKKFPELQPVYSDILADRYEKIEVLAGRPGEDEPPEYRLMVKRLMVLARCRKGDFANSVPLFREVAEATGAGTDWFNLVRAAVTTGDIILAQAAFDKVEEAYEAGNYGENISSLLLRYYFAQSLKEHGEYDLAFEHVNKLRAVYEKLHITDDTFIYLRGVPLLSNTMDLAMSLFPHLSGKVDPVKWIDSFSKKLDDEGRRFLSDCKKKLSTAGR